MDSNYTIISEYEANMYTDNSAIINIANSAYY